ncbi:hypothetical protein B7P43_G03518 [Cryptotermes secundus]|uniref:Uncharacterized protein n=1 Tax=Cryptotermes secundus TaxID=105785 RepID=A0A2J7R541_9NEOP|nr:hypothetical protein B7P43_G03518 [Cryptotermes secundus]
MEPEMTLTKRKWKDNERKEERKKENIAGFWMMEENPKAGKEGLLLYSEVCFIYI